MSLWAVCMSCVYSMFLCVLCALCVALWCVEYIVMCGVFSVVCSVCVCVVWRVCFFETLSSLLWGCGWVFFPHLSLSLCCFSVVALLVGNVYCAQSLQKGGGRKLSPPLSTFSRAPLGRVGSCLVDSGPRPLDLSFRSVLPVSFFPRFSFVFLFVFFSLVLFPKLSYLVCFFFLEKKGRFVCSVFLFFRLIFSLLFFMCLPRELKKKKEAGTRAT